MKKLYRSRTNKMLFGVCGGIGDYFNVDPTLVRVGAVMCACFGFGLLAYPICAVIIPEEPIL